MNAFVVALIVTSVTLSAAAQIVLKHGMSAPAVQSAIAASGSAALIAIASNVFVWGGLFMYFLGAVMWLGVLARVDVSQAYPFVGLAFVLTMVFAVAFLGEPVRASRIIGTALIIGGVLLVARS